VVFCQVELDNLFHHLAVILLVTFGFRKKASVHMWHHWLFTYCNFALLWGTSNSQATAPGPPTNA